MIGHLIVVRNNKMVSIDVLQFSEQRNSHNAKFTPPLIRIVKSGVKQLATAKFGRGSLLLSADETEMTLFEVIEPYIPRD